MGTFVPDESNIVSIRSRTVLIALGVLLSVTLVTAWIVDQRVDREIRARAAAELDAAMETARQLESERDARLALQADLLTSLLPLSETVATGDRQAIGRLLDEFSARPRTADAILVLDPAGRPFATAGTSGPLGAVLSPEETAAPTLPTPLREGHLVATSGHLYGVLARRLGDPTTRATLGTLVVAEEVGVDDAASLARLTGSEVVLLAGGTPVASSLPLGTTAEVSHLIPTLPAGTPTEVEVRGKPYLARLQALRPDGTSRLFLYNLSLQPSPAVGGGLVLLIGLAGALLICPLLWLGGQRLQRALTNLSEAMAETAVTGRLERDLSAHSLVDRWAAPEVGRLASSFHSLMHTVEESLRDRERSYVEAVGAVVAAIDARDHETTGHSFRVAHYALTLAKQLRVDGERLQAIEWGALLHDVGKIAVPDAILRKADRLTEEEWHVMRQHPNWGFEMLADVKFLEPALEIVYSHHERWDGGGYPRGLRRREIPLAARIFAVVDTYDSITSDRPYRRSRSHAEAITELCRVAGTQLDPEVVEAFIRISEVELRRLRERSERLDLSVRMPDAITELPAGDAVYRS